VESSNDEAAEGRRSGRPDFSRMGNWSCWRNESVDGEPFVFQESWVMPNEGTLELDYVTTRRCSADAKPMSSADFDVR